MQRPRGSRVPLVAALWSAYLLFAPAPGQAAGNDATAEQAPPEIREAIENTLQLMETETQLATASRMNADYVPGILTVLRGAEIEERGLQTVFDALALVPGLNVSLTSSGEKRVVVRGVGSTFAPSTLKFMLNGVSLNSSLEGRAAAVFDIPAEQVDRIEIIRGPGAMLYGEYANAGVINVVTRQGGNRVFARAGSERSRAGGGLFTLASPLRDFSLSLNVAVWDKDGGVAAAADKFTGTPFEEFSRAPGRTNEAHQNVTGVLALRFKGFALCTQYTGSRYGDYFGLDGLLPPPDDRKVQNDAVFALEASQDVELTPTFSLNLRLGRARSERDWDAELLPAGFTVGQDVVLDGGLVQDAAYRENRSYAQASLKTTALAAHTLLFGLGTARTDVADATMSVGGKDQAWVDPDAARWLSHALLQDEFEITERLMLTGGLRYDKYNDVGGHLTPRLSGVYRIGDRHIFKLQYAEAFRPPTFLEQAGLGQAAPNPDLEPETVRTYEGGYIHKSPAFDARLTVFHSELDDLIVFERDESSSALAMINSGGARTRGVEAETLWRLARTLTLNGNVSYARTRNNDTGEEIGGSANWLANLGLLYQPWRRVGLAVSNRYVGRRHRGPRDDRPELDDYDTVDVVLNLLDVPWAGVTLRAGVSNAFDANVEYPSFPYYSSGDLVRPGRQWWAQLSYEF